MERILHLKDFKSQVRNSLMSHGYGDYGPECRLSMTKQGSDLRIVISQTGGRSPLTFLEVSLRFDKNDDLGDFLDETQIWLNEGEASGYNIVNKTEFLDEVQTLLAGSEEGRDSEQDSQTRVEEEAELQRVIEELREESVNDPYKREMLGGFLIQLADLYSEKAMSEEALTSIGESIEVIEGTMSAEVYSSDTRSSKRLLARALAVKARILMTTGNSHFTDDMKQLLRSKLSEIKSQLSHLPLGWKLSREEQLIVEELDALMSEIDNLS